MDYSSFREPHDNYVNTDQRNAKFLQTNSNQEASDNSCTANDTITEYDSECLDVKSSDINIKNDVEEEIVMPAIAHSLKLEPVVVLLKESSIEERQLLLHNGIEEDEPECSEPEGSEPTSKPNLDDTFHCQVETETIMKTDEFVPKKIKTEHKKHHKPAPMPATKMEVDAVPAVVVKASKMHHPSALVEKIDYKLLEGKKGVDLLTAIELQTNVNLSKMEFHLSSSSESTGNVDKESPRKARTRSVESVVWGPEDKRERKRGMKRPRSVETGPKNVYKFPKLDAKACKPPKQATQVPSSKRDHKKDNKLRDKHDYKSEHKSSSRSTSDRRKAHKASIGIQARPSRDHSRHYLKLIEPRPSLLASGNFTYPPSDVSTVYYFILYTKVLFLQFSHDVDLVCRVLFL